LPVSRVKSWLMFVAVSFGWNRPFFNTAKRAARASGKPLLNVGCKAVYTSECDVNLDIVPRRVPRFVQGDIQDLHMFRDKQFGAVFASHVLEHVEDPDKALSELRRVAEGVFIISPLPLWPWTYLHPEHRWLFWGSRKLCRYHNPFRLLSRQSRRV